MAQVTAIITKIIMDEDYHVYFYDQYGYVVQTLQTDTYVEVVDAYLVCGSNGDSIKFYANTVELIEGPTFSQSYTPLSAGFYQQGSQYFERLSAMYDYIKTNVVNVVVRDISALKFRDGTTQTTAATGGGGSGTVTSVGFTEGTGIDITGTNPITTSGTITITNTAPDQVVTMTDGTGIDVTGTYPNFTVTNTAPDQTVVLTEGTGIDITGTYPNFTIASTVVGGIPHGTASGTDTYTTTITGVTAYNDADSYLIRFTTGNTTVATLNINGLGAIPLYRNNDGELIGGDIIDGAEMLCVYNSTTNRFQVIGTAPNTLLAYVTNADTVAIVKGQPVYAFGGQGDRLTVKRASNSTDATSAQTVGLVLSASIGVNQKGLIILNGQLDGLSSLKPSAGWADGDPVYLGSTPGSITNVKPYAPNHLVYLGFVTTANNGSAGRMYVRVQNGYEMDELHNVQAQNPNLNDTLYYDNTVTPGQWKTASIPTILGYTPGQGTVTSVSALTLGTSGTDLSSSVATGTTTPVITLNVPTASATNRGALSSTDWNTFNGKQNAITLTTTGTSGAATLVGSTLNIPQYGSSSQTLIQKAALGYEYYNDFLSTPTASGSSDGFGYIYFFSGASAAVLSTSVPTVRASNQHGFIRPTTGTTNTGYAGIYGGTSNNQFLMGGGAMTFQTSVLVNTLSTGTERYRVVIGYGDQATNAAEVNGIFFTYDEGGTANGAAASPNWQCVTTANSVRTLTTSTVPISTSAWHYLRIEINAAGTSVGFYINGILEATHTTNIPSGASQTVTPRVNISKTIGTTSRFFHMDYLYYAQTYTTTKPV